MIYLSSDHGGYNLKTKITDYLKQKNIEFTDLGPETYIKEDDYPDYIVPTMLEVQSNEENKGIVICRNGVGVNMLANKFKNIRATLSFTPEHAGSSRNDDNTNVLSLPADYISEQTAIEIVDKWLSTNFSDEERHKRRLEKVKEFEEGL